MGAVSLPLLHPRVHERDGRPMDNHRRRTTAAHSPLASHNMGNRNSPHTGASLMPDIEQPDYGVIVSTRRTLLGK